MQLSESGRASGWHDYPAEEWEERKPVTWLHDWDFWEYCVQQYADANPILELACGNGRITRQLALSGYRVVAVDINPHFLNRAIDHLSEGLKEQVKFVLQDVVHLSLSEEFALALMADWSFPALLTQDDQIKFLENLRKYLVPRGIFAFNTPLMGSQRSKQFDLLTQVETRESGGNLVRLRHSTLSEIRLLARLTGYEIIEQYGGVDRRPLRGAVGDDLTIVLRTRS